MRTRRNDHEAKVYNGARWQVTDLHRDGSITVSAENGRSVRLSRDYVREFVELDYAATLDSAQGITVTRALPVVRDGMGRSQLYSAATRGRQAPEYLAVGDDQNFDAAGALRRVIETNDLAKTAHEIAADLARQDQAAHQAKAAAARVAFEIEKARRDPPTWETYFTEATREVEAGTIVLPAPNRSLMLERVRERSEVLLRKLHMWGAQAIKVRKVAQHAPTITITHEGGPNFG